MNITTLGAAVEKSANIIFISEAYEKFYYEKLKEVRYQDAPLIISDYDICTILVNAMDNAVEACERIKGGEKWITVSIGIYQEYLHFIISNSSVNVVDLKTRKADKRKHGIGLENLQECVKRNAGEVTIRTGEGKFVMDVLVKGVAE